MAKINARNKGKSGEYEVIKMLQTIYDDVFKDFFLKAPILRRNTAQYADGGEDVAGLTWHSVEVKRCEKLEIGKWWLQATRQAAKAKVDLFKLEILENCPNSVRKIIYEKFGEFRGFEGSWGEAPSSPAPNNLLSTSYPDLWTDCGQIVYNYVDKSKEPPPSVDKCGLVSPDGKKHSEVLNNPRSSIIGMDAPLTNKKFSVSPSIICQNLSPFLLDKKCPCLLYRQNKSRWNAVLWARLPILDGSIPAPVEVSEEVFIQWFRTDLRSRLLGIFGDLLL